MKTVALIADRLLWDAGLPGAPGAVLPGAKELLTALRLDARVVIVSTHLNTLAGHRRVLSLMVGEGLPYDDLWVAPGFPEHDEVVAHVPRPE